MQLSNTINATFIKRYKRFLADVILPSGETITVHVPNTGSMQSCLAEGMAVVLSKSPDPKRKYSYTLEMSKNKDTFIGLNTGHSNKIVYEAILDGKISELQSFDRVKPEAKYGDSRLDFLIEKSGLPNTYVEVKNVTLKGNNDVALFPDAVTSRGQKHLEELMEIKRQGMRAVMLFLINREDVTSFAPANHIDPTYGQLLKKAQAKGVEVLCYQTSLTQNSISIAKKIKANI